MSKSYKIAGLVVVLLGIMVATTYLTGTTPEQLDGNKANHEDKAEASNKAALEPTGKVKLPQPTGPKNAPVKVKVYVTSDNHCDTTTLDGMKQVAKKFGTKVRVEFVDLLQTGTQKEAHAAKISCKSGITLNGMSVLRIPGYGVKGLVMFDGPMGKDKNYGVREIEAGVQQLLDTHKATSKGKQRKSTGSDL